MFPQKRKKLFRVTDNQIAINWLHWNRFYVVRTNDDCFHQTTQVLNYEDDEYLKNSHNNNKLISQQLKHTKGVAKKMRKSICNDY